MDIKTRLHARQFAQLLVGLWLYGATMALMIRAGLGLDPWDVFHQGLSEHLGLSFGAITAIVGAVVLLAWIPLRQRPGIGTFLNIAIIAISVDATLAMVPTPASHDIEIRCALLIAGVVGNGLAGSMYVGARLGAGPRDGLWVGIVERSRFSVRQVRTAIEVTVLSAGFLLGGTVNFGTVFYALSIGPIVQFFLPRFAVPLPEVATEPARAALAAPARHLPTPDALAHVVQ